MAYKYSFVVSMLLTCHCTFAFNDPLTTTARQTLNIQSLVEKGNCKDTQSGISLDFRDVGLRRINSDFTSSPNVSYLNLEDNEIDYVSPTAFRLLPNLSYLNLARNNISIENFSQLNSHSYLRTLILDENNFQSNEDSILEFKNEFPCLTYLYIRNASLKSISSLSFAPNLKYLYLSSNNLGDSELSFINDNASASLIALDVAHNNIQNFNASKLRSLEELRLDGNSISRLCGKSYCQNSALVLEGATELQRLYLVRNKLTSIESNAFDNTTELTDLDLSYNQIESIGKNTFESVDMLRNLFLKENLLSEIPDLYGPEMLENLSLANNQIEIIKSDSFALIKNLKYIDLSNNKIKIIEKNAFAKQNLLEILDLSNNKIRSFPDTWLTPLWRLKILYVNGNLIKQLQDLKLLSARTFANLQQVFLQNNSITAFHTSTLYYTLRNVPNVTLELFDTVGQFNNAEETLPYKSDSDENINFNLI